MISEVGTWWPLVLCSPFHQFAWHLAAVRVYGSDLTSIILIVAVVFWIDDGICQSLDVSHRFSPTFPCFTGASITAIGMTTYELVGLMFV